MKANAHKIGAVFYAIWGVLHVVSGWMMLNTLASEGGTAALGTLGNGVPAEQLTQNVQSVAMSALGLLFWDLVWFGVLVTILAVTLNWKNSVAAFWITLGIVLATDTAYMYAIVLPGYIAFPRGFMAPPIAVLAIVFSMIGYLNRRSLAGSSHTA